MEQPATAYQSPSFPLHTMLFRPSRLSLPNKLSPFPERPTLYQFDSGSSFVSTTSTYTITSDSDPVTTPTPASAARPSFIHPFASSATETVVEPDIALIEPSSPSFHPRDRAPSLPVFPTTRSCSLVEAAQNTKSAHKHLIFSLPYDPPTRFPTPSVDDQLTPRLDCVDIQAEKEFEEEQLADMMRLQAPVLPTKDQFSPGLISPLSPYGNPFDKVVQPIIRGSPSTDSSDGEDDVPTFTFDSPGGKASEMEEEVMELDLDPSLDPESTEAEKREEERRRNLWRSVRSQSDGGLGINFGLTDFDIGISLETLYRRHSAGGIDRKHTRFTVTRDPDLFEGFDIRSNNRTPVQDDMKGVDPLAFRAEEEEDVDMDAHDDVPNASLHLKAHLPVPSPGPTPLHVIEFGPQFPLPPPLAYPVQPAITVTRASITALETPSPKSQSRPVVFVEGEEPFPMQRIGSSSTLATISSNQDNKLSLRPTTSSSVALRRLNRKQAPALTESLLNLSLVNPAGPPTEGSLKLQAMDQGQAADEFGSLVRGDSHGSDETAGTLCSSIAQTKLNPTPMYSTISTRNGPGHSKGEDKPFRTLRKRNKSFTDRFFDNPFKRPTSSGGPADRQRKVSEPFNPVHLAFSPVSAPAEPTLTPSTSGELTSAETQASAEHIATPPRQLAIARAPIIPSRGASLPVNPDSEQAKLLNPAKQPTPHPFLHFLYPDSPLVDHNEREADSPQVRRPSAGTFMTGYSLNHGDRHEAVSDDESPPLTRVALDQGEANRDKQAETLNAPPLLHRSSSSDPSFREQMPFGRARSRKDPSKEIRIKRKSLWLSKAESMETVPAIPERRTSGQLQPPDLQVASGSTSRMNTPRLGVDGRIPPHKYSGSHHSPSFASVQSPRSDAPNTPNTWAELEAIEAEEAQVRIRTLSKPAKPSTRVEVVQPQAVQPSRPKATNGYLTDASEKRGKAARETWSERKARKKREDALLEAGPERLPTPEEVLVASELEIRDPTGKKVKFGSLLEGSGDGDIQMGKTTIVIFIRHWYCPLCGDYVDNIVRTVPKSTLDQANIDLIIIGNGSYKMIPGYSKHFEVPFRMYTDSKLRLYRALGMTRQTGNGGADEDKGDYIQLTGMGTVKEIAKRATKMPLRNPGSINQIGGEFIFRSPLTPIYAHRMLTTRDHSSIRDIIYKAGALLDFHHVERGPPPPDFHRTTVEDDNGEGGDAEEISEAQRYALEEKRRSDGLQWVNEREHELARIKKKREERQSGSPNIGSGRFACEPEVFSDSEGEIGGSMSKKMSGRPIGIGIMMEGQSRFKEMLDSPTRSHATEEVEM